MAAFLSFSFFPFLTPFSPFSFLATSFLGAAGLAAPLSSPPPWSPPPFDLFSFFFPPMVERGARSPRREGGLFRPSSGGDCSHPLGAITNVAAGGWRRQAGVFLKPPYPVTPRSGVGRPVPSECPTIRTNVVTSTRSSLSGTWQPIYHQVRNVSMQWSCNGGSGSAGGAMPCHLHEI